MEFLWNNTLPTPCHHRINTLPVGCAQDTGKHGRIVGVSEEAAWHNVRGQSFVYRSSLPVAPYSCPESLRPPLPAGQCEAGEP